MILTLEQNSRPVPNSEMFTHRVGEKNLVALSLVEHPT